jgi:hypothetical protein
VTFSECHNVYGLRVAKNGQHLVVGDINNIDDSDNKPLMGVTTIWMIASVLPQITVCFKTLLTMSLPVLAVKMTVFVMMRSHQKTTLMRGNPFQLWPPSIDSRTLRLRPINCSLQG